MPIAKYYTCPDALKTLSISLLICLTEVPHCERVMQDSLIEFNIFKNFISEYKSSYGTNPNIQIRNFFKKQMTVNPDFVYRESRKKGSLKIKWNNKKDKLYFEVHRIIRNYNEENEACCEQHIIATYSDFL